VFGIDRSAEGVPNFDFKVCGPEPGRPLRTSVGAFITPDHGLDSLVGADLVAIPAISGASYMPEALEAIRAAVDAGAIVLTVCSGAFVAGAAGLLDGRPCTTHWMHADELARMYPTAQVDRNVLFVDDGNLITSAGTAAGIDACLHLVRRELGSEVTNTIARRMVVPPQRDGGQRQYIDQPIPVRCSDGFAPHLDWILTNLDKPHTVATLAKLANMSARTFARRFVEETGRTPMQWVTDQRVLYARRLLEESDLDIDHVADKSGFGTATLLRHHFRRVIGVTPSDYRRRFACDDSGVAATA
jgi:transcriptional regulator GlxA family with amidase domain